MCGEEEEEEEKEKEEFIQNRTTREARFLTGWNQHAVVHWVGEGVARAARAFCGVPG